MIDRKEDLSGSCSSKNSNKKSREENSDEDISPVAKKKPKLKSTKKSFTLLPCEKTKVQCSILKFYRHYEMGLPYYKFRKPVIDSIINYCKTFRLYKVESPFDRRVTFILWHPKDPRLLSVTSHGGDLVLYNYEQDFSAATFVKGIGAGGSVQGMKFDPLDPTRIYTASMEGKFLVLNFQTKEAKQFLETNDINRWYISVDVNSNNNVMVAGDTKGKITLLTLQGKVINTLQVHNCGYKVSHAEFSKLQPWLLCTSSTDCSLKLWDIRSMRGKRSSKVCEPVKTIYQDKPINAAYFSLTDGCRLLTTDQMDKIKIYRAPLWNLETDIHHPHRQFQHLTPIKAYWHPLEDIVFVGRYPHINFPGYTPNELRTLDFFDADTGELLYQHSQSGVNGIMSINRFNILGDALASSYGYRFMIWKPNFKHLERISKKKDRETRHRKRFGRGSKNDNDDDDDEDDDDDDDKGNDGEIDWAEFLKNQTKERQQLKKKTKKLI